MAYLVHSKTYPYIVMNVMAGVYRIFRPTPSMMLARPEIDGNNLLAEARRLQKRYDKRVCAVFAPDGCIYMELDGSNKLSDTIPAGGMIFDPFEV